MKLTDHQRAELREAILAVMPEMVDFDNNGPWWWECGCNDDGHLNDDGRMCSLSGAWGHVVDNHLAPLIERWLSPAPPETRAPQPHVPYTDDGVTYCGWRGDSEVFNGCGEVWPCSTVRAKTGHQDDDA